MNDQDQPTNPELPNPEEDGVEQLALFESAPDWKKTWKGMPEFHQDDLQPEASLLVHFKSIADRRAFAALINQTITDQTKSLWYPKAEIGRMTDKRFKTEELVNPRYPVYIISKGRWESRLTANSLEKIGVPFRIVVEPQELENYAAVMDRSKILVLPFSNLGQGSIPARNWVWEHAVSEGHARHWILDDNIDGFYRLHKNIKTPCATGSIFRAAEDFSERYTNVGISGFNYFMFAPRKSPDIKPFTLNTRIYSCILIKNDIPYRWRGRYNEDTDLSIRALKDGWCTVLFNAFLAMKMTTMTMKGGNSDELYVEDGRRLMAESLQAQHPDIVHVTRKWNRWQHHVNYGVFRNNKLVERPDWAAPEGHDNYGMELEMLAGK